MSIISMPLRASYTLLRRRIRSQWRSRYANCARAGHSGGSG